MLRAFIFLPGKNAAIIFSKLTGILIHIKYPLHFHDHHAAPPLLINPLLDRFKRGDPPPTL